MEITCRSKALTVSQLVMHFTVSFELNSHARHAYTACNAYVNVRHWHHHAVCDQRLPAYLLAASRCTLLGSIHIYGIAGIFHQFAVEWDPRKINPRKFVTHIHSTSLLQKPSCKDSYHTSRAHPLSWFSLPLSVSSFADPL